MKSMIRTAVSLVATVSRPRPGALTVARARPVEPYYSPQQLKHLEMIQHVISRLAMNSLIVKGWTLTVVATILGLGVSQLNWRLSLTTVLPLSVFWVLDGYFLRRERLFRQLYDDARQPDTTLSPFSMDVLPYLGRIRQRSVLFSHTLRTFYGGLLLVAVACTLLTYHFGSPLT